MPFTPKNDSNWIHAEPVRRQTVRSVYPGGYVFLRLQKSRTLGLFQDRKTSTVTLVYLHGESVVVLRSTQCTLCGVCHTKSRLLVSTHDVFLRAFLCLGRVG